MKKGLKKRISWGFLMKGNVALLFALKHPGMVRRLILNGADLFPGGVKRSVQIPIIIGYKMVSFFSLFDKKVIARSIPDSKLSILEGDHFIAAKNWEAFNRSVDTFLTERE